MNYAPVDKFWVRTVMNRSTRRLVKGLNSKELDVLEISGGAWGEFGFRSYQSVDFPAFNICSDRLRSKFDLIICEQIFEHIRHPVRAAHNVRRMLRYGGHFLITTPFLVRYHPFPHDLWRWSAEGMQFFLEDCGFDVIESRMWGNKECLIANLDGWASYDEEKHSIKNQNRYPLTVWALARRRSRIDEFTALIRRR